MFNNFYIPEDANSLNMKDMARHLHWMGMVTHPVHPPSSDPTNGSGKKPVLSGWNKLIFGNLPEDHVERHFGNAQQPRNLGIVVCPPFVVIDIDSKQDDGKSAEESVASRPELARIPRERTPGGVHLFCRCTDVPKALFNSGYFSFNLTEEVTVELNLDRRNIVVAPSVHKSGKKYCWEVTGEIPEIPWAVLSQIFNLDTHLAGELGLGAKEHKTSDMSTRSSTTVSGNAVLDKLRELDMLGKCLDKENHKWAIKCPWEAEHSTRSGTEGSDTVVFTGEKVGFNCMHAHCAHRKTGDFLKFLGFDIRRAREAGEFQREALPKIVLPGLGITHLQFVEKILQALKGKNRLFRRGGVGIVTPGTPGRGQQLHPVNAASLVTLLEDAATFGVCATKSKGPEVFVPKSMDEKTARIVCQSQHFLSGLPPIDRVLHVPVPYTRDGHLVLPQPGYNPDIATWLSREAPVPDWMSFSDALQFLIEEVFPGMEDGGFCWVSEKSRTHAIARLLSPLCKGLMNWGRSPVWLFTATRPGSGKDTCADVAHIVYTGGPVSMPPVGKNGDEELRKKLSSAVLGGTTFFHLANMKEHLDYPALEAATSDSTAWTDRILGSNKETTVSNEMEISISSNNATWTPDFERRCRIIELFCPTENVNSHQYRHPELRVWVLQKRTKILGALLTLIVHWHEAGRPAGPSRFTSFPAWSRVVGGIMHCAGLGNPCLPNEEKFQAGDTLTAAMKSFFTLAHEKFGENEVSKATLMTWIAVDDAVKDLFPDCDLTTQQGRAVMSKKLGSFKNRTLGGVTMEFESTSKNHAKYCFVMKPGAREQEGGKSASGQLENLTGDDTGQATAPSRGVGNFSPFLPGEGTAPVAGTLGSGECCGKPGRNDRLALLEIREKSSDTDKTTPPIRYLALQGEHGDCHLVNDQNVAPLRTTLQSKEIILGQAKAIMRTIQDQFGICINNPVCLETLAVLLGKPKEESTCDTAPALGLESMERATGGKLAHLLAKADGLINEADAQGISHLWRVEMLAITSACKMEARGVLVDKHYLENLTTGEAEKHISQGAKSLLAHCDSDSRIRATFTPLGASTGRFSVSEPALQSLERHSLRKAIIAPPGDRLVIADYSQIELRLVAAISADQRMLTAFRENRDLHALTGEEILKILGKKAPSLDARRLGKAVNFGLLYGQSEKGLAEFAKTRFNLEMTEEEARLMKTGFLKLYPGINRWQSDAWKKAENRVLTVETKFGRKRLLSDDSDKWSLFTAHLNTPVQGGCADGLKLAMGLLDQKLPPTSHMIMTLHDELVIECPEAEAGQVAALTGECMRSAMEALYPEVPIVVDSRIRSRWED